MKIRMRFFLVLLTLFFSHQKISAQEILQNKISEIKNSKTENSQNKISEIKTESEISQTENSKIKMQNTKQKNWTISLGTVFSAHAGKLGEYVYDENDNSRKMSELHWQLLPLLSLGENITARYKNFSLSFFANFLFPMKTGHMFDSDWLVSNDVKNCYSVHPLETSPSYSLGGGFSYTHPVSKNFSLAFDASLNFEHILFHAQNGYGWYGDKNTNESWNSASITKNVIGIDYLRETLVVWLGSQFSFSFFDGALVTDFSFALSPYSFTKDLDHHIARELYFTEIMHRAFGAYKLDARLLYFPIKNLSFNFSAEWKVSNIALGHAFAKKDDESFWSGTHSQGGADFAVASFSLGGTYYFRF